MNQELNQLPQLNADITRQRLEAAIKEVAIGVANTEKAGDVTLKISIKPQKNTNGQVNIDAKVSFSKPTDKGKRTEETTDSTPMFVSRDGVSAIKDQGALNFDNDDKVTELKSK
nr:hypothetical protein 11 [Piscirickettsiaceae bacterium]